MATWKALPLLATERKQVVDYSKRVKVIVLRSAAWREMHAVAEVLMGMVEEQVEAGVTEADCPQSPHGEWPDKKPIITNSIYSTRTVKRIILLFKDHLDIYKNLLCDRIEYMSKGTLSEINADRIEKYEDRVSAIEEATDHLDACVNCMWSAPEDAFDYISEAVSSLDQF